LLINKGEVLYQGQEVSKGIDVYYSSFPNEIGSVSGSGRAEILSMNLSSNGKTEEPGKRFFVNYLDELTIELCLKADHRVNALNVNVAFFDKELRGVAQVYSVNSDFRLINDKDTLTVKVRINQVNFNPGTYSLSLVLTDEHRGETLINYHAIKSFQVTGPFIGFTPVQIRGDWSRTS
jgi:lipopolysaccharide transport system ATP-binding protein